MATGTDTFTPTNLPAGGVTTRMKKVRGPWLALGFLLILLSVLGSVYAWSYFTATDQYLVLVEPVERGTTIDRSHLGVAAMSIESPGVELISPASDGEVLGRRVLTDLPVGTLLSPGLLSEAAPVPEGTTVVGLTVNAGVYPIATLSQGDTVALVRVGSGTSADVEPPVEVSRATVYARTIMGGEGSLQLFLSLEVNDRDAAVVAALAQANRLYLVQVDEDTPPLTLTNDDLPDGVGGFDSAPVDTLDGAVGIDGVGIVVFEDGGASDAASLPYADDVPTFFDLDGDGADDDTGEAVPQVLFDQYA